MDIINLKHRTNLGGAVQAIEMINKTANGRKLWVVSEKYGKDFKSGFRVYLAYRNSDSVPSVSKNSSREQVYNVTEVPTNSRELSILRNKYVQEAKKALNGLTPRYLK